MVIKNGLRVSSNRPTPCEVGIVQASLDLFHTWARVGALNNSCPLRDNIEQQRLLAIIHCGCLRAFGAESAHPHALNAANLARRLPLSVQDGLEEKPQPLLS